MKNLRNEKLYLDPTCSLRTMGQQFCSQITCLLLPALSSCETKFVHQW